MADGNQTMMTEFILLGFTTSPNLRAILFVLFLWVFLMTLVRNIGMILLIQTDHLHTPMYFFISNLAFLDVTYSTIITSTALMTSTAETKAITFTGCAMQFFLFCIAVSCERFLLAGMAYNRFMAICNPLLYTNIMSMQFCVLPVLGSYTASCINAIIQTSVVFCLSFCHSNNINHFFCDAPPVLKLSCSNTLVVDIIHFTCSTVVVMSTILIILMSYTYIIIAILKIQSSKGRHKAFSTCASHLIAAMVFYGTPSFMYLWPSSKYSVNQDKITSVFYALANLDLQPEEQGGERGLQEDCMEEVFFSLN